MRPRPSTRIYADLGLTVSMPAPPISNRIGLASTRLLQLIASEDAAAPVRLFGSAAVALRCPRYRYLWDVVSRVDIADIDLVTTSSYRSEIRRILTGHNLVEDLGSVLYDALFRRLLFNWPATTYTVEVFFDPLDLHHKIELGELLTSEPDTITLADLLLTKLQFEDLRKRAAQLLDLCIILAEHDVVRRGGPGISANRIGSLTGQNWGLWHTVKRGLDATRSFAENQIHEEEPQARILSNIKILQEVITAVSHTPRWKAEALAHKLLPCLKSGKAVYEPSDDSWLDWRK